MASMVQIRRSSYRVIEHPKQPISREIFGLPPIDSILATGPWTMDRFEVGIQVGPKKFHDPCQSPGPTKNVVKHNSILVLPVKVMLVVTDRCYSPQAGNSSICGTLPIRRMRISVTPPEEASAVFNRRWAYLNGFLYNVDGSLPKPSSETHAMAYTDIHHIRFCEQETRDLVGKSPANEWHYQFEVLIPVERWLKEQKDTTTLDVAAEVEFGWDPDTSRVPAYTVKATEKLALGRATNNLPVCLDENSISLPLLDSTLTLPS